MNKNARKKQSCTTNSLVCYYLNVSYPSQYPVLLSVFCKLERKETIFSFYN